MKIDFQNKKEINRAQLNENKGYTKIRNQKLHCFCGCSDTFNIMKSRILKWADPIHRMNDSTIFSILYNKFLNRKKRILKVQSYIPGRIKVDKC